MKTWTDVVNAAFDLLGEPAIGDIAAPSNTLARRAQRIYPQQADYVLAQRRWAYAEAGQVMAADALDPVPGFQTVITLPASCRRVNFVYPGVVGDGDPSELFSRARVIFSRMGGATAPGRIVIQSPAPVTVFFNEFKAPALLGPAVTDLIAARLAFFLTVPQSESRSKRADNNEWVKSAMRAAAAMERTERNPHPATPRRASNWLDAMASGTY